MKRRHAIGIAILSGLGAVLVPILASLYLTNKQSLETETKQNLALANEVLRRVDETDNQSIGAIVRLLGTHAADPCSDANIALMRQIAVGSSYIQAVGHVEGDRLVCSSLGRHAPGTPLGHVGYVNTVGVSIRPSVELLVAPGMHFLIAEKNGYAVVVHRDLAIDVFTDNRDVSLGVFAPSTKKLMLNRGHFDPQWMLALNEQSETTFFDGNYVVAISRSKKYDNAAFTATPAHYLDARERKLAAVLVPIGAFVGLLSLLSLGMLGRYHMALPQVLRLALKHNEVFLHYQPIVELSTGRCVGAEALIRWRRQDGSFVPPNLFIQVAEECGLIRQITARVIELLRKDVPPLLEVFPDFQISFNLSPFDLETGEIVAQLRELSQAKGLSPKNLHAEITERCLLNAKRAKGTVQAIRKLGIGIAIDDFGTGFCGLSYLNTFEVDFLKIDKAFVDTMGTTAATSQVATHIIDMAKSLNLEMIAEGVETEEQAAFLRHYSVRYAQGWLFAKAMSIEDLIRYSLN
jgi:sensor c-di-GMP phosphodiesterase-like protein